jgi:hypothetical protein
MLVVQVQVSAVVSVMAVRLVVVAVSTKVAGVPVLLVLKEVGDLGFVVLKLMLLLFDADMPDNWDLLDSPVLFREYLILVLVVW